MKFTLEIELGNAAMKDMQDLSLALMELGDSLYRDAYAGEDFGSVDNGPVRDGNGNRVGSWEVQ